VCVLRLCVIFFPPFDLSSRAQGFSVVGAALGGAHSVVLAEKRCEPSLSNPWGMHRLVYAFG